MTHNKGYICGAVGCPAPPVHNLGQPTGMGLRIFPVSVASNI